MAMDVTTGGREQIGSETMDALNSFLRGEISAAETYRMAIEKIDEASLRAALETSLMSHERRVSVLRERISGLGGTPAEGSGAWGGFAKLVEGGAKVFGVKAAIAALEEGEDHGKRLYRDHTGKLDAQTREWVQRDLVTAQEQTHAALSALKRTLH